MQIIDDFLDQRTFNSIRNFMLSEEFPWSYIDVKVQHQDSDDELSHLYNTQMCHLFYADFKPFTQYFDLIAPLVAKIDPVAILKIKANLTFRTHRPIISSWHTDNQERSATTAIYYLNSNNGQTIFKNGDKFDSVENRLLVFPSNLEHTGSTSSDTDYRAVINLNYFV